MARAPGRLDVMGGIADYSGSLVLQVSFSHVPMVFLSSFFSLSMLLDGVRFLYLLIKPVSKTSLIFWKSCGNYVTTIRFPKHFKNG